MTRDEVAQAALSLRGTPFQHQGRDPKTGIDCCGYLHAILTRLGVTDIIDVEGYRASPKQKVVYETLRANFEEIAVDQAGIGDVFLMRLPGSRKANHVSIQVRENQIAHTFALGDKGCVRVEPLDPWRPLILTAFRIRGLT